MRKVILVTVAVAATLGLAFGALACSGMKSANSTSTKVMDMASADQATTSQPMTPKPTTTTEKQ